MGAVCTDVDGGTANFPNQVNANINSRRALLIRRSQARATFPAEEGFLLVTHRTDSRGRLSLQVCGKNKDIALLLCLSAPQRTV